MPLPAAAACGWRSCPGLPAFRAAASAPREPGLRRRGRSGRSLRPKASNQQPAASADGPARADSGLAPAPLPADFKNRIAAQFDGRAPRYDDNNSYHPPLAAHLVQLAELQEGEAVLDVGCGTGLVALLAAKAVGSSGRVTGIDLSPAMIHLAAGKAQQEGLHNVVFLSADVDECEYGEERFDAILCSSAIPFLPDIPRSLAEWHSWLRPGGRVAFNAPKGVGSQAFTVFVQAAARQGLHIADPSSQFADEAGVRDMLTAAGFSRCSIGSTQESNVRAGQTPQQWAEAGWALCAGMPFVDLPSLLAPERVEEMRRDYLAAAAELARGFEVSGGIAEPYTMLWVVASKDG